MPRGRKEGSKGGHAAQDEVGAVWYFFGKVKLGPKVLIIAAFGRIRVFTEIYYCWNKSCRVLNHRKMPALFLAGSYFS